MDGAIADGSGGARRTLNAPRRLPQGVPSGPACREGPVELAKQAGPTARLPKAACSKRDSERSSASQCRRCLGRVAAFRSYATARTRYWPTPKEALEEALAGIGAARQEAEDEELAEHLARIPDLGQALRDAPPAIKRQVFESFDLQIAYDKAERRVELTATVSEAVADAFENAKALHAEGSAS